MVARGAGDGFQKCGSTAFCSRVKRRVITKRCWLKEWPFKGSLEAKLSCCANAYVDCYLQNLGSQTGKHTEVVRMRPPTNVTKAPAPTRIPVPESPATKGIAQKWSPVRPRRTTVAPEVRVEQQRPLERGLHKSRHHINNKLLVDGRPKVRQRRRPDIRHGRRRAQPRTNGGVPQPRGPTR